MASRGRKKDGEGRGKRKRPLEAGGQRRGARSEPPEGDSESSGRTANTNMLKELAQAATGVVGRAASILEEEIAAGIVAARNVETRFVDVKSTRSGKPEEVMLRFRRDAHDVVDILMDLINLATQTVGGLTQSVIRIAAEERSAGGSSSRAAASVPTLTPAQPAHAGATAELSMALENDSDAPTEEFAFHATDLVSPQGNRIGAHCVTFLPPALVIPPHDRARLSIQIDVPEGASKGIYTGVVQATKMSQLRAMLLVPIE